LIPSPRATPFGGTIAHGLLTLSMLPVLVQQVDIMIEGSAMSVNCAMGEEDADAARPAIGAGVMAAQDCDLLVVGLGPVGDTLAALAAIDRRKKAQFRLTLACR
jgi:hypothetical protein